MFLLAIHLSTHPLYIRNLVKRTRAHPTEREWSHLTVQVPLHSLCTVKVLCLFLSFDSFYVGFFSADVLDVVPCSLFRYVCMELDLDSYSSAKREKIRSSLFFCIEFLLGLFIFSEMNQLFYASGTKSTFVFLFVINPAFPSTTLPYMLLILPLWRPSLLGTPPETESCHFPCWERVRRVALCIIMCVHVAQAYLSFLTDLAFVFSGWCHSDDDVGQLGSAGVTQRIINTWWQTSGGLWYWTILWLVLNTRSAKDGRKT